MKPLTEQQKKAKALIVEQGKSQKEAAALVAISEKTMNAWVKKFEWKKEQEKEIKKMDDAALLAPLSLPGLANSISVKKAQAKQLIEAMGYNQKQTAKITGISEKTIGKWVTIYRWKKNKVLENSPDKAAYNINGFMQFIKRKNRILHQQIIAQLKEYKATVGK